MILIIILLGVALYTVFVVVRRWRAHCAREKAVRCIRPFTSSAIASFFYGRELEDGEAKTLRVCLSEDVVDRVVSAHDLKCSNLSRDEETHTELCVWCALRIWAKLKSPGNGQLSKLPAFRVLAEDAAAGYQRLRFALSVAQSILAIYSSSQAQALQAAAQAASALVGRNAPKTPPIALRVQAFQLVAQSVLDGRRPTRKLKVQQR